MSYKWKAAGAGFAFALAFLIGHEGMRYKTYLDTGGVPTVCGGLTGPMIKLGQYYTHEQCEEMTSERALQSWMEVDELVKVEIEPWTWAALTSFDYNVGKTQFKNSTLLKKLNAGDIKGACNQLSRWIYDNGKKLRGLVRRREAERQLCVGNLIEAWHK